MEDGHITYNVTIRTNAASYPRRMQSSAISRENSRTTNVSVLHSYMLWEAKVINYACHLVTAYCVCISDISQPTETHHVTNTMPLQFAFKDITRQREGNNTQNQNSPF